MLGQGDPTGQRFPAGSTIMGQAAGGRSVTMPAARQAVIGGATYSSRFPQIMAGLAINCNVATKGTAEKILSAARNRVKQVAYDTGALYESLYIVYRDLYAGWAVATDIDYAPFIEFGGERIARPRTPFLVPSVEEYADDHIRATIAAVRAAAR